MGMFNDIPDPLARLEAIEINLNGLHSDKMQITCAVNYQAAAIELMSKQIAALIDTIKIQDNQIKMLSNQLGIVDVRKQLGFK